MNLTIQRILHPTDFTTESDQAFQLACGIARDHFAEIIVVHVVAPDDCRPSEHDSGDPNDQTELFHKLSTRLESLKALASDIPVTFQIKVGFTAESIAAVARSENCDLIVMAAHAHCYLHRQYRGSVSERLATITTCPILCFRQNQFAQQGCRLPVGIRSEFAGQPL